MWLLLWLFFEGLLTWGSGRRSTFFRYRILHTNLDFLRNIDETILGLPHLMFGGGLKRVIVLLSLLKVEGCLLGIAIIDLPDDLNR